MEEEIKKYIKQQQEAGVSRETIEKSLEENGWTREDIQKAFASFDALENMQVSENETEEFGSLFAKKLLKSFVVINIILLVLQSFVVYNSYILLNKFVFFDFLSFFVFGIAFLVALITILSGLLFVVSLVKYLYLKLSKETNSQKQSEAKKIMFYTGVIICLAMIF